MIILTSNWVSGRLIVILTARTTYVVIDCWLMRQRAGHNAPTSRAYHRYRSPFNSLLVRPLVMVFKRTLLENLFCAIGSFAKVIDSP